jgi:hypothetical protein
MIPGIGFTIVDVVSIVVIRFVCIVVHRDDDHAMNNVTHHQG